MHLYPRRRNVAALVAEELKNRSHTPPLLWRNAEKKKKKTTTVKTKIMFRVISDRPVLVSVLSHKPLVMLKPQCCRCHQLTEIAEVPFVKTTLNAHASVSSKRRLPYPPSFADSPTSAIAGKSREKPLTFCDKGFRHCRISSLWYFCYDFFKVPCSVLLIIFMLFSPMSTEQKYEHSFHRRT